MIGTIQMLCGFAVIVGVLEILGAWWEWLMRAQTLGETLYCTGAKLYWIACWGGAFYGLGLIFGLSTPD